MQRNRRALSLALNPGTGSRGWVEPRAQEVFHAITEFSRIVEDPENQTSDGVLWSAVT